MASPFLPGTPALSGIPRGNPVGSSFRMWPGLGHHGASLGNCKGLLIGFPAQPLPPAVCSQSHGPRDVLKSCQIMALLCSESPGDVHWFSKSRCLHRGLQPMLPEPVTQPCDSTVLCSSHTLSQGLCPCCSLCLVPLPESPGAHSLIF